MKLNQFLNNRGSQSILILTWILSFVYFTGLFLKGTGSFFDNAMDVCFFACLFAPLLISILAPNWKQGLRQLFLASLALPSGVIFLLIAIMCLSFFSNNDFGILIKNMKGTVQVSTGLWLICFSISAPMLLLAASSKWALQKIKKPNSK